MSSRPTELPLARKDDLLVKEVQDEVLIYDLKKHTAYCLNQTAALVWKHCDGRKTVAEIASSLEKELHAPVKDDAVWLALSRLETKHLLQERLTLPPALAGISRREFARNVAMGALALPMIIVLSNNATAQTGTCLPGGSACTSGAQCCSGICLGSTCA